MVVLQVLLVRLEVLAEAVHKDNLEVLVILQQPIHHKVIMAEITHLALAEELVAEVLELLEEIHLVHLPVDQVQQIQ